MAKAKKKKVSRHSQRLGAQDWIQAGLRTLARRGVSNVRVERLARDLKVTKGSFYWHFTDRSALLDAMLTAWRGKSTVVNEQVIEQFADQPREQLRTLLRLPETVSDAADGSQIELALRLWARRDEHVGEMVQEMQRHREGSLAKILKNCGVDSRRLPGLTFLLSSVMLDLWVTEGRNASDRDSLCDTMMDIVDRYSR